MINNDVLMICITVLLAVVASSMIFAVALVKGLRALANRPHPPVQHGPTVSQGYALPAIPTQYQQAQPPTQEASPMRMSEKEIAEIHSSTRSMSQSGLSRNSIKSREHEGDSESLDNAVNSLSTL